MTCLNYTSKARQQQKGVQFLFGKHSLEFTDILLCLFQTA